ncbi:MAG: ATP-dependent DNA helicase RecG [Rickettsiaceae bacterium]
MYNILFQPVNSIIPMKETAEKALKRLEIVCVRDLVFYKPYSYLISDTSANLSSLRHGSLIQAEVTINEIERPSSRRSPVKIYASNDTGGLILVFFNKIPPFIYNKLRVGTKCIVAGKVQNFDGSFQITHPDFIFKKSLSVPVEPVYHLTYGLLNKQLYGYILSAIRALEVAIGARLAFSNSSQETTVIFESEKAYMTSLLDEIKKLHLVGHAPSPSLIEQSLEESTAKLSAKELFANQVALRQLKQKEQKVTGRSFAPAHEVKVQILNSLGFELTSAQQEAIKQIEADQSANIQMMRLLQGDVGSGKTLVALLTMINVSNCGIQSALMAPTDLLSMQHYQFFTKALAGTNLNVALLTGKTTTKERRRIKEQLESGEINILIGTHALFQEAVSFKDLGYIVIDEQHRFGVKQRLELISKASHPDVLIMTATPIPRSLTLTMFGDMSLTLLKGKPKDRLPIVTAITSSSKKQQVIESLQKKLESGEKIYWVCPLIDQNDKTIEVEDDYVFSDVANAYLELNKHYPNQVGILHGKMKSTDKDLVMQRFKDSEIKILVATTVIEVGIDVPDATLMIIENAEKFGLAQLHQLRGRVGRGKQQSYCMLIYNPKRLSAIARRRLEIMRESNDGFYIAEQDLLLRGGGEILGTKQSGEPEFFFADLGRDAEILLKANKLANDVNISSFIEFQTQLFAKERDELTKSG